MDYRELITSKMHNKGALTLYLNNKKHIDVLNYLNDNIIEEARSLSISEKLWYFVNGIKTLNVVKNYHLIILMLGIEKLVVIKIVISN